MCKTCKYNVFLVCRNVQWQHFFQGCIHAVLKSFDGLSYLNEMFPNQLASAPQKMTLGLQTWNSKETNYFFLIKNLKYNLKGMKNILLFALQAAYSVLFFISLITLSDAGAGSAPYLHLSLVFLSREAYFELCSMQEEVVYHDLC